MAYTTQINHANSTEATIHSLENPFNTSYYRAAGFSQVEVANGGSTLPPSRFIIGLTTPSSSGTSHDVTITDMALQSDGLYGFVQAANGLYYSCGHASI